ncbi:UNVERIFIED_CONTAM: hypothetical protein Sradi_2354600 [Sesamum radiatum]|uniref:Uncharacterized protein n=1 Tax=Sesamum radiatum TaxID=300843 RepID=A0AAW2T7H2_SESRA
MFSIPGLIGIKRAMCDLGASINVMPLTIFKSLNVGPLNETGVVIQLVDRSIVYPEGVLEDVLVQVNELVFSIDFFVIDMREDNSAHSTSILLGIPFLKTARTKIDVHNGTLTMKFDGEMIKFNNYESMRYPSDVPTALFLDEIDPLVQKFSTYDSEDQIKMALERNLTSIQVNVLEEFMALDPNIGESIFELEALPSLHFNLALIDLPRFHTKLLPSIFQAPTLELKELPKHLNYAFLGQNDTLPVIISSKPSTLEEEKLIHILREFREAIGWTIANIKGLSPSTYMHSILLEEGTKPSREAQRRLNPPTMEVVKKEILKLLDAGMIFPIFDSEWVSPTQVVLKKTGITVIENSIAPKYLLSKKDAKPRLIRWILLLQEFDLTIKDKKKGAENLVADHLSLLMTEGDSPPLKDEFLDERLLATQEITPWYADLVNLIATHTLPNDLSRAKRKKIRSDAKYYVWNDPYLWKYCSDQIIRRSSENFQNTGNLGLRNQMPLTPILVCETFDVEAKATRTDDAKTVVDFVKANIFSRYGMPIAIFSDQETHFCKKMVSALLKKYNVTH